MHKKRGIALIIALLVIMVLAILTTALLSRSVTESRNTWRFVYAANAFWLSEAGIQRGLYEINNSGGSWTGWTDVNGTKQLQVTLTGRGDYDVTVSDPASTSPLVTAIGFFPGRASADAAPAPDNPVPTTIISIFFLLAGLTSFTEALYLVHF